jgi:hypothetical protein
MFVHTTIAFTPQRVPLGIIDQHTWVRPPKQFGKKATRRKRKIDQKESRKWLVSLKATDEIQCEHPEVMLVNVGDREADIYDVFLAASDFKCKLLVRAAWDRRVEHEQKLLWSYMEAQPVAATLQISVPQKNSKLHRDATVELRFAPVTIKPPRVRPPGRDKTKDTPLQVYAVYLHEPNPPEGVEPLSWMLLTTLPVTCVEEAFQIVEFYAVRWSIEVFHKVLKSGCRIEKRQLQTAERLRTCLALDSIVAWRILLLTMLGRQTPDLPCDVVFEEHEWKALYCFVHKTTEPPENPPALADAIRLVARVGGFLGRKSDGQPGITVLWRGLQRLTTISCSWLAFGPGRSPP